MNKKIIRLESIPDLAKNEGYNFICLIDPIGKKLINFNPVSKKISFEENYQKIVNKLSSPVTSPGRYTVLLSEKTGRGCNIDEYVVIKEFNNNHTDYNMPQPQAPFIIHNDVPKVESALSFDSALTLNRENAELKAERMYLLNQIQVLQDQVKELEAELSELESKPLSEGNTFTNTLTELAPSLLGSLGKFLEIQERKVALAERSPASSGPSADKKIYTGKVIRVMKTGSADHLQKIDELVLAENYEALSIELDKVRQINPDLYQELCNKYQMTTDDAE